MDTRKKKKHINIGDLSSSAYIDDGDLLMYWLLINNYFNKDLGINFHIRYKPLEWSSFDMVSFLIEACDKYKLKVSNLSTNYWNKEKDWDELLLCLGSIKNNINDVELYDSVIAVLANKFSIKDLYNIVDYVEKYMLIHFDREMYDADRKIYPIFISIIDNSRFIIEIDKESMVTIKDHFKSYLDLFIEDRLNYPVFKKDVNGIGVFPNNIFNYNKHESLFKEYLEDMYKSIGDVFRIKNKFEENFDNLNPTGMDIKQRYDNRHLLFFHTLFSFEDKGFIKIRNFNNNYDYREYGNYNYGIEIEVLPKFKRVYTYEKLDFDEDESILLVNTNIIKIAKLKNEYRFLRALFGNRKELYNDWQFSVILEKMGINSYEKKDVKYIRNILDQLNIKLERQGIKDLFIRSGESVQINKKSL